MNIRHVAAAVAVLSLQACGDGPTALREGVEVEVVLERWGPAAPLTTTVWFTTSTDTVQAGGLPDPATLGTVRATFSVPLAGATGVLVTVEPPGPEDGRPSPYRVLAGVFDGSAAELRLEGILTAGPAFPTEPGSHSLFTTSNNIDLGYPSFENAGLWLFSLFPSRNAHGTREVKLAQLRPGWTYEGWAVRRHGTREAMWLPYGKFRPDFSGLLSSRDDTGSGPFSGDPDYLNAGVEDVPGEEWNTEEIAAELGISLPGALKPPLALDAVDPATGEALWHHVITLEPAFDEGEPLYSDRPFFIRPYRNAIGPGGPGVPRKIALVDEGPRGRARTLR